MSRSEQIMSAYSAEPPKGDFKTMIRTIVESPFAGDTKRNQEYLQRCLWHSTGLGEAPFASHRFCTSYLSDSVPSERNLGMGTGRTWAVVAEQVVFYVDLGISPGMQDMIAFLFSEKYTGEVLFRRLGDSWPSLTKEELLKLGGRLDRVI